MLWNLNPASSTSAAKADFFGSFAAGINACSTLLLDTEM
jgi:hypothetical protein